MTQTMFFKCVTESPTNDEHTRLSLYPMITSICTHDSRHSPTVTVLRTQIYMQNIHIRPSALCGLDKPVHSKKYNCNGGNTVHSCVAFTNQRTQLAQLGHCRR